jgi:hypothetical protein
MSEPKIEPMLAVSVADTTTACAARSGKRVGSPSGGTTVTKRW